jgi:hypothetical protein
MHTVYTLYVYGSSQPYTHTLLSFSPLLVNTASTLHVHVCLFVFAVPVEGVQGYPRSH